MLATLAVFVLAMLVVAGCGHAAAPAGERRGSLDVQTAPGYVPLPGVGAPDTTPVDPRLASFCHQYAVFYSQVEAVGTALQGGDLAGVGRSLDAASHAAARLVGVAPAAIAAQVRAVSDYLQHHEAELQGLTSVAGVDAAVGQLIANIYEPYLATFQWFGRNCLSVIFAPGQQPAPPST